MAAIGGEMSWSFERLLVAFFIGTDWVRPALNVGLLVGRFRMWSYAH